MPDFGERVAIRGHIELFGAKGAPATAPSGRAIIYFDPSDGKLYLAKSGAAAIEVKDATQVAAIVWTPSSTTSLLYANDLSIPAAAVTNRFVTSANMKVGTFTLAQTVPSGTSPCPRNVTVTATQVGGADDTPGTVTIAGLDGAGAAITEAIIPLNGSTVAGLKAFASITSATQAGWVIDGGGTPTADTLVIGFGNLLGLPQTLSAAAKVFLSILGTSIITPTITVDASVLSLNTVDLSSGSYNGAKVARVMVYN